MIGFKKQCFFFFFLFSLLGISVSCNENKKNIEDYENRVLELENIYEDFQSGEKYFEFINSNSDKLTLLKDGFANKTKILNESTNLTKEQKDIFFALQKRGTDAIEKIDAICGVHISFQNFLNIKEELLNSMQEKIINAPPLNRDKNGKYTDIGELLLRRRAEIELMSDLMHVNESIIQAIKDFGTLLGEEESTRNFELIKKEQKVSEDLPTYQ